MVALIIQPYRGNVNTRHFPHSGYLALTPVKVDGVIRTKLDSDGKPLQASSIVVSVRCIESRVSLVGKTHSNVLDEHSQTLWTKPPGVEYGDVGDAEFPFKIVVPVSTPGLSCANFQDYRVFWRVEAVITHAPVFGVGSRLVKYYEIPLVRYVARVSAPPLPSPSRFLVTNKPRAPLIKYQLLTPTKPIGPLDIVTIPLTLHPVDSAVVIRSASLIVERRIELNETAAMPYPRQSSASPSPIMAHEDEDSSGSTINGTKHERYGPSSSTARLLPPNASDASISLLSLPSTYTTESFNSSIEQRPLQPAMNDIPPKVSSLTVAHVESSSSFNKDSSGVYTKSLTLKWPAAKSNSHWALGETMQTELINVRFYIRVKIIVSSSTTGTETIELEEREITLVSINESQRSLALANYNEGVARKSKSKSPRRTTRTATNSPTADGVETEIPSVPRIPQVSAPDSRSSHSSYSSHRSPPTSSMPMLSLRRPHTSAGPRDKVSSRSHVRHAEQRDRDRLRDDEPSTKSSFSLRPSRRPETAHPPSSPPSKITHSHSQYFPSHTHRNSRDNAYNTRLTPGTGFLSDPGTVRAWEEELERIEVQSRRVSADMLGFKRQRTTSRPNTAASSATSTSESSTL